MGSDELEVDVGLILTALSLLADGDARGAVDMLQARYPSAEGVFTVTYTLAGIIAHGLGGSDHGAVTAEVVEIPGGNASAEQRDVMELTAALIAAAGNRDPDGAAKAFYGAGAETAGRANGELMMLARSVIDDLRANQARSN